VYFSENGVCGVTSLMAWIISALCSLNKRYSQMEAAAAGILYDSQMLKRRKGYGLFPVLTKNYFSKIHTQMFA
jgi:hypothetical protein